MRRTTPFVPILLTTRIGVLLQQAKTRFSIASTGTQKGPRVTTNDHEWPRITMNNRK